MVKYSRVIGKLARHYQGVQILAGALHMYILQTSF